MNYYLVFAYLDVDPEIRGPFPSEELRDNHAVSIRREFGPNHGIYPLDIDGPGKPSIDAYSGGFFMEKEE